MPDHHRLACTLSAAAKAMPADMRRSFRAFLFSLDGAEPPKRKVHSWRRKKAPASKKPRKLRESRKVERQLGFGF